MKRHTLRSTLSLVLALVILVLPFGTLADELYTPSGTSQSVAAMDGEMGVMYSLISSITGTCYIENGKVQMGATVTAQGRVGSCTVTLTLQKKSGGNWTTDSTWTATGTGTVTKYASKTASSNVFYRLKVTGKVTNGGSSESDTIYTAVCVL